jgi:hypothetical protein
MPTINRPEFGFERDFTRIPNAWARDPKLPMRAKGLLTLLMSHKPGFTISVASLQKQMPEGRDYIYKAINELIEHGFLVREQDHNAKSGKYSSVGYRLTEPPKELVETASVFTVSGDAGSGGSSTKKTSSKKTIAKKTRNFEVPSSSELPISGPTFPKSITPEQLFYLNDLYILRNNEVRDSGFWAGMTKRDGTNEINSLLTDMPRGDDYAGPHFSDPAYRFLSERGQQMADARMHPNVPWES